jgi:hypothetical protein
MGHGHSAQLEAHLPKCCPLITAPMHRTRAYSSRVADAASSALGRCVKGLVATLARHRFLHSGNRARRVVAHTTRSHLRAPAAPRV